MMKSTHHLIQYLKCKGSPRWHHWCPITQCTQTTNTHFFKNTYCTAVGATPEHWYPWHKSWFKELFQAMLSRATPSQRSNPVRMVCVHHYPKSVSTMWEKTQALQILSAPKVIGHDCRTRNSSVPITTQQRELFHWSIQKQELLTKHWEGIHSQNSNQTIHLNI